MSTVTPKDLTCEHFEICMFDVPSIEVAQHAVSTFRTIHKIAVLKPLWYEHEEELYFNGYSFTHLDTDTFKEICRRRIGHRIMLTVRIVPITVA